MSKPSLRSVFMFALLAGSIMTRNGAPAATVTHTLLAVARTFGRPNASATVTMDQLTMSEISPDEDRSISISHAVGTAGFNLSAIRAVESTTKDVIRGDISLATGTQRLEEIESTPLLAIMLSFAYLVGRLCPQDSLCCSAQDGSACSWPR